MSTPNKDEDIGHLVELAHEDLSRQNAGAAQPPSRRRPCVGRGWVMVVWLAAAALWGWQLWPVGPSDAQVQAELEEQINEARTAVERHLAEHQSLPDRLPAPVAAVVVRYEVIDRSARPPTYALVGQVGEFSLRWTNATSAGSKP